MSQRTSRLRTALLITAGNLLVIGHVPNAYLVRKLFMCFYLVLVKLTRLSSPSHVPSVRTADKYLRELSIKILIGHETHVRLPEQKPFQTRCYPMWHAVAHRGTALLCFRLCLCSPRIEFFHRFSKLQGVASS